MSLEREGLALPLDRASWVVLAPHEELDVDPDVWREALVLVQRGTARVTCSAGESALFGVGSVLWLGGSAVRSIGAEGGRRVVLMRVRRCADPSLLSAAAAPARS